MNSHNEERDTSFSNTDLSHDPIPEVDRYILENGAPEADKEELRQLITRHADLQQQLRDLVERAEKECRDLDTE